MLHLRRLLLTALLAVAFTGAPTDVTVSARPAPLELQDPAAPKPTVRLMRLEPPAVRVDPKPVTRPVTRPPTGQPPHKRVVTRAPFTAAVAVERGNAAFASLHRTLPAGWQLRIAVYQGRFTGLAESGTKVLTLWVRPSHSRQQLRITLAHELGHVLDYTRLSDAGRARYLQLRGRSGSAAPWYPCISCTDLESAAGDFAEVYALWLAGPGDFRSRFAPAPDAAQMRELAAFFTDLEQQP